MGILNRFRQSDVEISKQAMEACEHIINEMGAELHDDLIQKLSILRLHLDKIERSSYDPDETREIIARMQKDFQGVIESVRNISRRLLPVKMDSDDFQRRVEMLCQNMDLPGAVRITASFTGAPKPLTYIQESYLLRMIQELIHNAFRHSSAWYVWVRVRWTDNGIEIEVEDDGAGFAKVKEFVKTLREKHNTLRMRTNAIGASITYTEGEKGLLARIILALQ